MFKKMFALASVTALTGLVATVAAAGCSSTTNTVSEAPETSSPVEAGKPKEASVTDPDTSTGPTTCPTTDAIDATTAAWEPPPAATPGACAEADIAGLVKYLGANSMATYANIKAQITTSACKACLFVVDNGKWGPFVEKADGSFDRINTSLCVTHQDPNHDTCGKAYSQANDCLDVACQDCNQMDMAALQKCQTAAGKAACKTAITAVNAACMTLQDDITFCQTLATTYAFEEASRAQCVVNSEGGPG